MTVKQGYKLTEVGVIPEDWDCKHLGELGTVVRGGSPRPAGDPKYFNGNFIPWLTVASLTNIPSFQQVVVLTSSGLTELGSKHSRILERDTLIISNSGATLGVSKILGIKCCANDGVAAIINQKLGNKSFVAYFINTKTKELHDKVATGNGQPNLNTELIRNIVIPFPKFEEQTAIANTLSNADAYINSLEQLIAKKQLIKQGTMQQLLTGKKRLEGFSGEWEEIALCKICDFINGRAYNLSEWESKGTPVIRLQNLTGRGDNFYYSNLRLPEKQYCSKGDLLFMWSATFGVVIWQGEKAIYHYHIWKVIPITSAVEKLFLFYILDELTERLKKSSSNGGTMLHITKEKMEATEVFIPLDIKEQSAIANILTNIDNDIQTLQNKLTKAKQIKQGMMQELLTGKTRLVEPHSANVRMQ